MPEDTPAPEAKSPDPATASDSTPAAEDTAAKRKALLDTPAPEAAEMDALLNAGLQAHNTIGFLTFVGVILIGLAVLYWRSDRVTAERPYASNLDHAVRTQAAKDMRSYRLGEQIHYPGWPVKTYHKLRDDMFGLACGTLLLALVFIYIERARMRRSDVLVYRALAREVEKLRLRVKKLEGRKKEDNEDNEESA